MGRGFRKEEYDVQMIPIREYAQQVKLEIAREEGREEVREENKRETIEIVRSLFKMGFGVEQVMQVTTKLTASEVEELQGQMALGRETQVNQTA